MPQSPPVLAFPFSYPTTPVAYPELPGAYPSLRFCEISASARSQLRRMPPRATAEEERGKGIGLILAVLAFVGVWAVFELGAWSVKRRLLVKHPKQRNRAKSTYH